MNKTQLVTALSRRTSLSLEVVQRVVDALFEEDGVIQTELLAGHAVAIRGFGTFAPKVHKPRVARDLIRNRAIVLPPTVVVDFKASERLKARMRG